MSNDLTVGGVAAAGRPILASLARKPQAWTIDRAVELLGEEPAAAILEARRVILASFEPVADDGPERAGWEKALGERLKKIGGRISPGMERAAGAQWINSEIEALSDLPAMVALTAAKRAHHRPMEFLNQVNGVIREIAAVVRREQKNALGRLDDLERELRRRAMPALPAPERPPLTQAEIDALPDNFRRAGLRIGALTAEQAKVSLDDVPPRALRSEPTLADYEALGLSVDEAQQALADRARMLRRPDRDGAPGAVEQQIGNLISEVGEAA